MTKISKISRWLPPLTLTRLLVRVLDDKAVIAVAQVAFWGQIRTVMFTAAIVHGTAASITLV